MRAALSLIEGIDSVLVVAGPAHGDILLMTPLIRALRAARPEAVIDALVYAGQSSILEGNPDLDTVVSAAKHPGVASYRRLLRRILRKYDLAISNKQTDRAIAYAWLAGRKRVSVVPADRQFWKRRAMHAWVAYDHDERHTLLQNNALGELVGVAPGYEFRLPRSDGAAAVVDAALAEQCGGGDFAVLHLNPGLPHKRWTEAGWLAIAEELARRGLPIVLTGDDNRSERRYLQSIAARMPGTVIDLSGKLGFSAVCELLGRCAVFIGTDTVTTHMAAAVGVPTVALFGPESSRVWGPWPRGYAQPESPWRGGAEQRVGNVCLLQSEVPCPSCRQGYCLRRSERARSCRLMQSLEPRQVIAALNRVGPQ